jgi:hypothetical protein
VHPTSAHTIRYFLLTFFPAPEKKERKKRGKERAIFWDLESVVSLSLSSHGGTRLDPFQGYAWSPAKPHESGVYDDDGAHGPLCAWGPHVPHDRVGIRGGLCSIL